jgi:hypothetical protein
MVIASTSGCLPDVERVPFDSSMTWADRSRMRSSEGGGADGGEYEDMKWYPTRGAHLEEAPLLKEMAGPLDALREWTKRYPDGLKGATSYSRTSVAGFDAMTTDRPYSRRLEAALAGCGSLRAAVRLTCVEAFERPPRRGVSFRYAPPARRERSTPRPLFGIAAALPTA